MEPRAYLVPAEEHDGDECCLHEEGEQAFDGKRCSEDVPHKPRIVAPVGPELKLQDYACGDTHREVYAEERHPEFGRFEPFLAPAAVIERLHYTYYHAESERQRHEEPMVHGGEGKQASRPVDYCH